MKINNHTHRLPFDHLPLPLPLHLPHPLHLHTCFHLVELEMIEKLKGYWLNKNLPLAVERVVRRPR